MEPTDRLNASDDPRERILDAASSVFAEAGFGGARVDEIARRAGTNKAMLYYHVGDKQALYADVLLRNFQRALEAVTEALGEPGSAADRLRAVVRAIVDMVRRHPEHPRIVLRELASGADNLPPPVLERMLAIFDLIRGLLDEGVESGEFRRTDPLLTHLTIIGSVIFMTATAPMRERVAEVHAAPRAPGSGADLVDFLSTMLLQGLTARSSTGGTQ